MGKNIVAKFRPIKNSIEVRDEIVIKKICLYIKNDIEAITKNNAILLDDIDIIKTWAKIKFGIENIPNPRKWLLMMYYDNRYFDDKIDIVFKAKKKESECSNRLLGDKFISKKKVSLAIKRISIFVRRELIAMGHNNAMKMKQNQSNSLWIKEVFGVVDVKPTEYLLALYESGYFKDKDLRTRKQRIRDGVIKPSRVKYSDYNKYIKSAAWLRIRDLVLLRDNNRCIICGFKKNLHIHHMTYKHLFKEEGHLEELVTLCQKCHDTIHAREGGKNNVSIAESNKKLEQLLK